MCEPKPTDEQRASRRTRSKIWELDPKLHCPIIGTCLTLLELRRLYGKVEGSEAERGASDYEIHVTFVSRARQSLPSTKLVQKFLDKKFQTKNTRFSRAKRSEELVLLWDESIKDGDVAGPFWALVTHPSATEELLIRVYGEVHMLSHLTGASTRADLRRLSILERRCTQLEQALDKANSHVARQFNKHQAFVQNVSGRLSQLVEIKRCLKETQTSLEKWESGAEISALRKAHRQLERELAFERVRSEQAQREVQKWAELADSMADQIRHLQTDLDGQSRTQTAYFEEPKTTNQLDLRLNLSGRRILYVGGLSNVAPHLRALVERYGGRFLHYDGLHHGHTQLGGLLDQADAILCPLNCVSHEACGRIKQFCKQHSKPLVMLRNASLSCFSSGLRDLAS